MAGVFFLNVIKCQLNGIFELGNAVFLGFLDGHVAPFRPRRKAEKIE